MPVHHTFNPFSSNVCLKVSMVIQQTHIAKLCTESQADHRFHEELNQTSKSINTFCRNTDLQLSQLQNVVATE